MNAKELLGKYKLVLGLEIHLHPKTEYKMFCGCSANIWQKEPNSQTCPTCLGLPGALPVPNLDAIKKTQLLGLALNCKLNKKSQFDRKHYFYPDLPKGYQISQYKQPLCGEGSLKLESGSIVEIERIHLEEDVAKSFHKNGKTCLDFNKSGLSLIELVTKPTFRNTQDAVEFSKKLQSIVRKLNIGEVDMEKGQMRLEANISLRTQEMEDLNELPKYKVEIKNINSFRFMEKAVRAEILRQKEILESGGEVKQENRGWDETTGKTVSQREKEEAHDYRYFPEPDIPPMEFSEEDFNTLKEKLVELPDQTIEKLVNEYGVSVNNARVLVIKKLDKKLEDILSLEESLEGNVVAKLLINKKEYQELDANSFIKKLKEQKENEDKDMLSNDEIKDIVKKTLKNNLKAIEDYKKGKENALSFLLGIVLRESKGKIKVDTLKKALLEELH